MSLETRINKAETEASARMQAERLEIVNELTAWRVRCIDGEDRDCYLRWLLLAFPPEQHEYQELREELGEFVKWRDEQRAARVFYLPPLDIMKRIYTWDDGYEKYLIGRRRFHALLRIDVLRELGRLSDGDAARQMKDWFDNLPSTIVDADRRVTFHGLRWVAVESYLPGVTRAEFESLAPRFGDPSDEDRRALFDAPRLPEMLADALADELGL